MEHLAALPAIIALNHCEATLISYTAIHRLHLFAFWMLFHPKFYHLLVMTTHIFVLDTKQIDDWSIEDNVACSELPIVRQVEMCDLLKDKSINGKVFLLTTGSLSTTKYGRQQPQRLNKLPQGNNSPVSP